MRPITFDGPLLGREHGRHDNPYTLTITPTALPYAHKVSIDTIAVHTERTGLEFIRFAPHGTETAAEAFFTMSGPYVPLLPNKDALDTVTLTAVEATWREIGTLLYQGDSQTRPLYVLNTTFLTTGPRSQSRSVISATEVLIQGVLHFADTIGDQPALVTTRRSDSNGSTFQMIAGVLKQYGFAWDDGFDRSIYTCIPQSDMPEKVLEVARERRRESQQAALREMVGG